MNTPLNRAMRVQCLLQKKKRHTLFIPIWSGGLARAVDHRIRSLRLSPLSLGIWPRWLRRAQVIHSPPKPSNHPRTRRISQVCRSVETWLMFFKANLAHAASVMFSFTWLGHQHRSRLCDWCEAAYDGRGAIWSAVWRRLAHLFSREEHKIWNFKTAFVELLTDTHKCNGK